MQKLLFALAAVSLFTAGVMLMTHQVAPVTPMVNDGITAQNLADFNNFKLTFSKQYNNPEQEYFRLRVYLENQQYINEENAKNQGYTLAENQLADFTKDEFVQTYLGLQAHLKKNIKTIPNRKLNAEVNWVTKGDVTAVKDQGSCGSCWAFSATGAVESLYLTKKHSTELLSEQQLVDCSRLQGNLGCQGGLMQSAFKYIEAHGITTEDEYPYRGKNQVCNFTGGKTTISSHKNIPEGNCDALSDALQQQPIAISVDASNWSFYKHGIFHNCGKQLNHGILLVGEDKAGNWLAKNSWGTQWGQSGYITLADDNTCGICDDASYPVL